MAEISPVELAQRYVALSNDHDLNKVFCLFDHMATYHSSQFGSFMGRESIEEMMGGFFSKFPDICWTVDEYVQEPDRSVSFEFIMRATSADTGETVERRGIERIYFGQDELITHVEVGVTTG
jgi:hypothetical protein